MKRRFLFVLLLATGTAAVAGFPVTEERTCPIGGERFSFTTTASYSTWGARPDGKPFELKKRFDGPGGLAGLGRPQ